MATSSVVAMAGTDWTTWHDAYARPGSGLAGRLAAVRSHIARHLDSTAPSPVRVISACAGDGRDLLGVLADRDDADRVDALLVEQDDHLAERARAAAAALPSRVEVVTGDAAVSDVYAPLTPAGLVLMCGIFGNISDADIETTVAALPGLCAPGAEVIWTRHRHEPDVTPSIRQWFADAGFVEVDFVAPADDTWSVGVHRLVDPPHELPRHEHWFTFVR